jgi:hypothetical protein
MKPDAAFCSGVSWSVVMVSTDGLERIRSLPIRQSVRRVIGGDIEAYCLYVRGQNLVLPEPLRSEARR